MSDTPRTHARELADVGVALSDRLDNMTEHASDLEREADSLRREVSAARLVLENILARIDMDEWIPSEYVQQAREALNATSDTPQSSAKQDASPQVSHTGGAVTYTSHAHRCMSCGARWYCPHPPGDCRADENVFPSLVLPGPGGPTVFHHGCQTKRPCVLCDRT